MGLLALIVTANRRINASLNIKSEFNNEMIMASRTLHRSNEISTTSDKTTMTNSPEQYGIYAQDQGKEFWNDGHWQAYVSKTLNQTHVLDSEESAQAFERMRKTPEEFKRRLEDLDNRIKYYEDLKRKDLNNEDIQKKLENLYILKSTLLALESKIVSQPKDKQQ